MVSSAGVGHGSKWVLKPSALHSYLKTTRRLRQSFDMNTLNKLYNRRALTELLLYLTFDKS